MHLADDFYCDLARVRVSELIDYEHNDGVVELNVKTSKDKSVEVLFAFNVVDFSLANGLESINYLIIAFDGANRCATDFCTSKLSPLLDI